MSIENNVIIHSPLENEKKEVSTVEHNDNKTSNYTTVNNTKKRCVKTLDERIADKEAELLSTNEHIKRFENKKKILEKELVRLKGLKRQEDADKLFGMLDSRNINFDTLLANLDLFTNN